MENGVTKRRLGLKAFISNHALLMSGINVDLSVNYIISITNFVLIKIVYFVNESWKTITHGLRKNMPSKCLNSANQSLRGNI